MHTTTVRFPADTWAELKAQCADAGVPTAQYIREATIARMAVGIHANHVRRLERRIERLEQAMREGQRAGYGARNQPGRRA